MANSKQSVMRLTICLAVLCLFISAALAQDRKSHSKNQATAIPTSDNMVTLKLTLPDGQVIEATEREGGLIRIETEGIIMGIVPHIRDMENGIVSIEVFRITRIERDGDVGEAIKAVESFEIDRLSPKSANTSSLGLQVKEIRKSDKANKKADSATSESVSVSSKAIFVPRSAPSGKCCVTCGGTTACGCAVVMSCGSCCSDPCC